jgi:hypothetical protein
LFRLWERSPLHSESSLFLIGAQKLTPNYQNSNSLLNINHTLLRMHIGHQDWSQALLRPERFPILHSTFLLPLSQSNPVFPSMGGHQRLEWRASILF